MEISEMKPSKTHSVTKLLRNLLALVSAVTLFTIGVPYAEACTRVLYETGTGTYITGRNMDWNDFKMESDFWIFPRGMKRDGGVGPGSITWTSKYGSVIISVYNMATSDGVNEAGMAGNLLYLAEAGFGDPAARGKPTISVGAWLQYLLDNYGTVAEAVGAMRSDPFTVVSANAPNGRPASVHISLSDTTGDSAIFEYINGKLVIHHSREYKVMTNSPVYEQQLAIDAYWNLIGGKNFLPGTISAADRFVRASYDLKTSPKFKNRREAVAAVFSQMRSVGVPLGMSDPDKPNISSTLWRTVIDQDAKRYYFDSVINPSVIWVDLDKVDLKPGAKPMKLKLGVPGNLGGEVSSKFEAAQPFKFLAP
jgi:penicillin V acylase-like amidase (Ntn superfamily)